MKHKARWLWVILLVGGFLRLLPILNAGLTVQGGGDSLWYLANGYILLSGEITGSLHGIPVDVSVLPTPPLYPVYVGLLQYLFFDFAVIAIRLGQLLMGLLTIYASYQMTWLISEDKRASLVVACVLSISPAFVIEPSYILTESLYMCLVTVGLWQYMVYTADDKQHWQHLALVGVIFGLASLTRAVLLVFPLGLALHLIIFKRKATWVYVSTQIFVLLLSYACITFSWTAYNWVHYERFVVGSDQLMPAIWRGAVEGDSSPQANDALLGDQTYTEQTIEIVRDDPSGFVQRRLQELVYSYLQPHGTIDFSDESLRALALDWVRDGFSPSKFLTLIQSDGFWIKLAMYIVHYGGLILGAIGILLIYRRWRYTSVLVGFIAYTTLIHIVMLALPRYIFPLLPILWIFAAMTVVAMWDTILQMKNGNKSIAPVSDG